MKKLITGFILVAILVSCATIMKGSEQLVTINSNVQGAIITLDGKEIGKTPFTGKIPRGKESMQITKKGYQTYTIALSTQIEGMFWGNILIGGTVGSITDFSTGAMYAYAPSSFQVDMVSGSVSMSDFEAKMNLRKFAMVHMTDIALNVAEGNGEYLSSLLELAKLSSTDEAISLVRNNLVASKGDQIDFGNLMVSLI
jgi:hypothetical protein